MFAATGIAVAIVALIMFCVFVLPWLGDRLIDRALDRGDPYRAGVTHSPAWSLEHRTRLADSLPYLGVHAWLVTLDHQVDVLNSTGRMPPMWADPVDVAAVFAEEVSDLT